MQKPIRWGVLGASNFARKQMAPAIHEAEGAELAALATSSGDKFSAFQAFCPGLQQFTGYEALLADPSIDAVYIPLPNHLHVEWAEKALRAGKHVLCEKPIALSVADVDRLIALGDETGLLVAEAFMIVHHPQWQRAREMVEDGAIGRLMHVDGVFTYNNHDAQNIRNRPETGGGALRDIGVYPFGAIRYVSGAEPVSLTTDITWENDVDTTSRVSGRFDGFSFSSLVSMRMHPRQEMNFHGENGMIRLTAPFNARVFGEARIELHQPGLGLRVERFPSDNHYRLQVENFGRSIRAGTPYPCPLEFSRGTQVMLDQILAG